MIEVGRVCVKLAGRDAGKKCVIIDVLDDKTVLIEGETRRRKCNVFHLEPLKDVVKVDKNAAYEKVCSALGIDVVEKKPREKTERPKKIRKKKEVTEELEKKVEKKPKEKKVKAEKEKVEKKVEELKEEIAEKKEEIKEKKE